MQDLPLPMPHGMADTPHSVSVSVSVCLLPSSRPLFNDAVSQHEHLVLLLMATTLHV